MDLLKKNNYTEREEEELADFRLTKLNRDRPYRHFNSSFDGSPRDLNQYIDYSQAKFNQFVEYPEDTENYEIQLALPNIRNKMMAILARLSSQRMKAEFFPQNSSNPIDKIVAKFLKDVFDWTDYKSKHDVVNFYWMLETATKGTGILLEDYWKNTRVVKDIKVVNDDGTTKWKKRELKEDGLQAFVLPLEEIYIWNMREPDIQKQHKVYWATLIPLRDFKYKFKNYKKSEDVLPGGAIAREDKSFYNEYLDNVPEGSVQVLHMWNWQDDEFKIISNGVELTEEDNPIPFNHKRTPLIKNIYEPLAPDFFYGKSFPDIAGNLSDAIDQLFNDTFNLNQLRMKAPLLAQTGSILSDVIWRSDNVVEYDGDKPEPMKIQQGGGDVDRLNNILFDQLNQSSVSPVGQGQVGSQSTAREVVLAEEHASERMNMFLRFMEWGEKERAELRISNILQFLTTEDFKELTDDKTLKTFRTFVLNNVKLANGRIGTREIRFKPEEQLTPPAILEKQNTNKDLEVIEISVDFLRKLSLYVKIVPNSSIKMSEALKKALNSEFAATMVKLFPNVINIREIAFDLIESFDKDPEKLLVTPEQSAPPEEKFDQMFGGGGSTSPRNGSSVGQQMQEADKMLPELSLSGLT